MMHYKQQLFFFLCVILFSFIITIDIDKEVNIVNQMKQQRQMDSQKPTKPPMQINSDVLVTSTLSANSISAKSLDASGNVKIISTSKSNALKVKELTTNTISVEKIKPKNGVLTIYGNVVMANEVKKSKGDSFSLKGVEQWKMISHDDFEDKESLKGWSDIKTNNCTNKQGKVNTHLGGHCNFAGNEVKKIYTNLPKHKILRVNAVYHMLDLWKGEKGYMKIDGETKWSKKGITKTNGNDFCGGDEKDASFNMKIDITIEHDKDEVEIVFGSTLQGDPCVHSFAVDDVMIYTK